MTKKTGTKTTKKIAILRGINVGGKRKILMADLKQLFEALGFSNVLTYIQSGNVIFDTTTSLTDIEIIELIEKSIADKYGFFVPVLILSAQDLEKIVHSNPFYQMPNLNVKQLHITFLREKPKEENMHQLISYNYEPDKFVLQDKAIFIFCEGKYHQSKLSNTFFEKKLNVSATTRNWKTTLKLEELSKS